MLSQLGMMWEIHSALSLPMYQSILEYVVNSDMYYRMWMAAELQTPTTGHNREKIAQPRAEWLPQLVDMFEDVRLVPGVIRTDNAHHLLDGQYRFHTGNKHPSVNVGKMELFWGVDACDVFSFADQGHVIPHPVRSVGPAKITFTNLRLWHHQNIMHRKRGDAILAEQVIFQWNTKQNSGGAFRANGPFQIVIKGFRAAYRMGERHDASYDSMNVSWGNENGIRLGEERVHQVIAKHDIQVNYLLSDSVFSDPGEEFIFWDEIGREQA